MRFGQPRMTVHWVTWRQLLVFTWRIGWAPLGNYSAAQEYARTARQAGWTHWAWWEAELFLLVVTFVPWEPYASRYEWHDW